MNSSIANPEVKLFRSQDGDAVKKMLSEVEGISFRENPLDYFILLARYKFAARFIKKNQIALDAGCGQGNGTIFLSKFAGSVVGADADQELVAKNSTEYANIPNVSFKLMNLLDGASIHESFDAVVSMDVIEHFKREQTEIVAENYAKLTKSGGFAIIGTPNIVSQPFASARRRATHIHEFEPSEFEGLLSKHFRNVFLFSMTDEVVSTSFPKLAWYLMALCVK